MSAARPLVLIVDDDAELRTMLREYLTNEQFDVEACTDGPSAIRWLERQRPDIVLLDVTMPGASGFDVLKRLRGDSSVPVLMLTARDDQVDRILGFEFGADDYVTKPFNARELVARINAILRRAQGGLAPGTPEVLKLGEIALETGLHRASVADVPIDLTDAEYRVLELLVRNAGRVVSRSEITRRALGRKPVGLDRSADTHVSNLRRKLGPAVEVSTPIVGVRGAGYMLGLAADSRPGD